MIYILWTTGDGWPMNWYYIFPTKKAAMKEAENVMSYSANDYPKGIRYFRNGEPGSRDAAHDGTLVIEQATFFYNGA